ncbi:MAG: hypothetical protein GWO24_25925 [Akkermansiaceae bacterium]|nr:hypothetical protein [Akkermansiaceae bacterium]
MALKTLTMTWSGSDMLTHNIRLSLPLDPHAKALKRLHKEKQKLGRKASEEELEAVLEEMAKVEWYGGTYYSERSGFHIPWRCIKKSLNEAARLTREGKKVERAVQSAQSEFPLVFSGSDMSIDEIWERGENRDTRAVRVGTAMVPRCRPFFPNWSMDVELLFESDMVGRDDLINFARDAGRFIGIGDGRNIGFGRFNVTAVDGLAVDRMAAK